MQKIKAEFNQLVDSFELKPEKTNTALSAWLVNEDVKK